MKPTVYWGGIEGHPLALHQPIQLVYKDFISTLDERDTLSRCPSVIDSLKDMYVLKSTADIEIKKNGDVFIAGQQYGQLFEYASVTYAQYLDHRTVFFADSSVTMTMLPPFLHNPKVQSICGSFDIGQWFRPISYTQHIDSCPVTIKKGEALCYFKFDKPVELKQVTFPTNLDGTLSSAMQYKAYTQRSSLLKHYEMFKANRLNKIVLKKIKEYNDV